MNNWIKLALEMLEDEKKILDKRLRHVNAVINEYKIMLNLIINESENENNTREK